MRKLKHHEQKLLKKVDFLNVSRHLPCKILTDGGRSSISEHSGNRMHRRGRSR